MMYTYIWYRDLGSVRTVNLNEYIKKSDQGSIAAGRTVETGAAARPGGLGTARRHQAR